MDTKKIRACIDEGRAVLGVELGSTRIKCILIDEHNEVIASGGHGWENQLVDNVWTYSLEAVWSGIQDSYAQLLADVKSRYSTGISSLAAIGFSAMMHGYMVFDEKDNLLVPFRTWRNTMTEQASEELTELFNFHIPQRWSIAHLDQAILNKEEHVEKIAFQTTLAGYIHWKLTGEKVLGVGEASGMFPINTKTRQFDEKMIQQFDDHVAANHYPWKLKDILPEVLVAGDNAGQLTKEGAKLLDVSGELQEGIPFCPPEGDAGTGMAATNSVEVRTGNVSAGTSVFAMIVLEHPLTKAYPEIDLVTTPSGDLVAMVHCNNCTSDVNAWVNLFKEYSELFGFEVSMDDLYTKLFEVAMKGDADCGGLLAYNYFSGEHITGFEQGRPLFVRMPDSHFTLANFMRTHLYTALGALKTGMDILIQNEQVNIDQIVGHGGFFKTKGVGQNIMAAAMDVPVSVMETASEGGAWGIALLASYMVNCDGLDLPQYLKKEVFDRQKAVTVTPDENDVKGFNDFMKKYACGLSIEKAAVDNFNFNDK